jgi:hypothetical protein|tara:strand:+ start:125 stop:529 length:405 start_codon:yes stop_codon:yes gene_type:complete
MIEDDFYATIKLKTGEEIFAKVSPCTEEDRTLLFLSHPIVLSEMKGGKGVVGYKVEKWLKSSDGEMLILDMENVLTMSESKDMHIINMHQHFTKHLNEDFEVGGPPNSSLSRKMGFLGNVDEAKKLLEKLYKDH